MYRFTPPTTEYRAGRPGTLWGRVKNNVGRAVVMYDDGRVTIETFAPSHTEAGVSRVFPGGRTYDLDDDVAADLIASGYSAYMEEVA